MREEFFATPKSPDEKVYNKEDILKMWPQAAGELRGFKRVLEQNSRITAAQIGMALQLAEVEFQRLSGFVEGFVIQGENGAWLEKDFSWYSYDGGMGAHVHRASEIDSIRKMTAKWPESQNKPARIYPARWTKKEGSRITGPAVPFFTEKK